MSKLIALLILFLAVLFVFLSLGELEATLNTLRQANPVWLLPAFGLELVWLFIVGEIYLSLYRLAGITEQRLRLIWLAAAANFITIVVPAAGMSGLAVFINDARRRGHSVGKATVASTLFLFLDLAAFIVMLALGWIVLIRRNELRPAEVTASLILFTLAISLATLLYLGYRSAEKLGCTLAWLVRRVNSLLRPFLHRDYLREERAHTFAAEIAEGLSELPNHSLHALLRPFLLALLDKFLLVAILLCSFLAFSVPFSAGTLIAGWAIGYLFLIVSPTPSGIGIVEGILPLALTGLRVPYEAAVLITLTYRAITFWFLLGLGAWAFRHFHLAAPS